MRKDSLILVAGLALVGTACEKVESEDVNTSGIYANIQVVANGDGQSQVIATLKVGGDTSNVFIDMSGDDKLEATSGEENKELAKDNEVGNIVRYKASFDGDEEDKDFKVAFIRTVDDGAPESTVTLPAPFGITSPDADTSFSRENDDLVIEWENAGTEDAMHISANGDCVKLYTKAIDGDPGTHTIEKTVIDPKDEQETVNCPVTVTITRTRGGTLDTAYGEGGVISGQVVRTLELLSTP
jgi:hypothetical protein